MPISDLLVRGVFPSVWEAVLDLSADMMTGEEERGEQNSGDQKRNRTETEHVTEPWRQENKDAINKITFVCMSSLLSAIYGIAFLILLFWRKLTLCAQTVATPAVV